MAQIDRLQTKDPELNRVQDRILQAVNPALAHFLLGAQLLEGVSLVTGTNDVDHKLGRRIAGWWIVGMDAGVTIYDILAGETEAERRRVLRLESSGNATVSLVVF